MLEISFEKCWRFEKCVGVCLFERERERERERFEKVYQLNKADKQPASII